MFEPSSGHFWFLYFGNCLLEHQCLLNYTLCLCVQLAICLCEANLTKYFVILPKKARESSVAVAKPVLLILPEYHWQHHDCISNFISPNIYSTWVFWVLWLNKNVPQPSNDYLCPSLPSSSPLRLGK